MSLVLPSCAFLLALALILTALVLALFPHPLNEFSLRSLCLSILSPRRRTAHHRPTPLELVRASQRAKERESLLRRPAARLQQQQAHAKSASLPADLPSQSPPPPPPPAQITKSRPDPRPLSRPPPPVDNQSAPRRRSRRTSTKTTLHQSSASTTSSPLETHHPPPVIPPSSRFTQTFSLDLEPSFLAVLEDRARRPRANSLPASAGAKPPRIAQLASQGATGVARSNSARISKPHPPPASPSARARTTTSSGSSSSSSGSGSGWALDPYAPCFHPSGGTGPTAGPLSLSLSWTGSLSFSLSPLSLSPDMSASSTMSLSPPLSPADMRPNPFAGKEEVQQPLFAQQPEVKVFRRQPFDAYLVLDVEATCEEGGGFDWPNEIIEWPVVLMKWSEQDSSGRVSTLTPVAEFRSFVRPTWAQTLSPFCTDLTGITQSEIDSAPTFTELLGDFFEFLVEQGLVDGETGEPLERYTFATDGPWDLRDFLWKQCWLSGVEVPRWMGRAVVDVRKVMRAAGIEGGGKSVRAKGEGLSISCQLARLNLPPFEGRPHSGIDDTRNIARILCSLAGRGAILEQNTLINPGGRRQYDWLGEKRGSVVRGSKWGRWGVWEEEEGSARAEDGGGQEQEGTGGCIEGNAAA